jgi:hypothetical protein
MQKIYTLSPGILFGMSAVFVICLFQRGLKEGEVVHHQLN